jgi:hypothetical protein
VMASEEKKIKIMALTAITLLYAFASCNNSESYKYTIADDLSGEQLSARVSVTDRYGQPVHIEGMHTDVEYLGKKWCYTDGQFSVTVAGKGGILEVRRGPETLPVKISLDNGHAQIEVKLHRWTNRHQIGYLNGDIHIHTPFSETAHLQMKA